MFVYFQYKGYIIRKHKVDNQCLSFLKYRDIPLEIKHIIAMRRNNVVIVPAKCQHTGKMYGIRTERRNNGWHMNWAFELLEEEAVRENFGEETISGRVVIDPEYPGCLYCGGKGFVHCGKCGKLSCWDEEEVLFSCHHCGHTGEIGMSADEFDDIKAGDY
jgi:hypothetical protein